MKCIYSVKCVALQFAQSASQGPRLINQFSIFTQPTAFCMGWVNKVIPARINSKHENQCIVANSYLSDKPIPTIGLVPTAVTQTRPNYWICPNFCWIFWTLCCSSICRNSLQLSINVTRFCYHKTLVLYILVLYILVSPPGCLCILMAIVHGV